MIHSSNNFYAIIYTRGTGSGNPLGVLIELEISPDGSITYSGTPIIDQIGVEKCFEPKIVFVSTQIYVVAYRDYASHPLQIATIKSRDPTLPWYRGIFKYGSINIYSDENNVYASLVTEDNSEYHLSLEGIIPDNWYHIVLTFDGSKIRLYCNKENTVFTKSPTTYYELSLASPTPKTIKIPNISKLYFGYLFYGYIDEVAIHNEVLIDNDPTSPSSIQYHFYNLGFFENET